jgi:hypothetical protein
MKRLFFFASLVLAVGLSTLAFAQTQVESGNWSANHTNVGYNLNENQGERSMTLSVSFVTPFDRKPDVVLNVTKLDCSNTTNTRYNVTAISVSRDGFTIKIDTWADSKIFSVGGTWIAHAKKMMDQRDN